MNYRNVPYVCCVLQKTETARYRDNVKRFNACSGNAETPGAKYSIHRRMPRLIKCIHPKF